MDVRRIDPDDAPGWSHREAHALVATPDATTEYSCLAAVDADGATLGIALCQLPQRDNRHTGSVDVRVRPDHRRRGIGTVIVAEAEHRLAAAGRTVVNCHFEVPDDQPGSSAAAPFVLRLGYSAAQIGHRRHLTVPIDDDRRAHLLDEVARAAVGYRIVTFTAPWPREYLDDQCELLRRMSTDQPTGDLDYEEEVWDAARVEETDRIAAAQGLTRLVAVAEDVASGRLVAFTTLALPRDHPAEGWQWATLVLREHRGHRLGLAVKLANLDALATVAPAVRLVITGNAQENLPMIAVNDMVGFQVTATGTFWQKELSR